MSGVPAARRVRLVFHGRVQGVGFRAATSRVAAAHPVTGYVANRWDGTVELVAEGSAEGVEAFLAALRRAPAYRHVDREDRRDETPTGAFSDFRVETRI